MGDANCLLPPAADIGSGAVVLCLREELDSTQYSVVAECWPGGVSAQHGVAPRGRTGGSRWCNLLQLVPICFAAPIGLAAPIFTVALAKGLRVLPAVESSITADPGESELPANSPVGFSERQADVFGKKRLRNNGLGDDPAPGSRAGDSGHGAPRRLGNERSRGPSWSRGSRQRVPRGLHRDRWWFGQLHNGHEFFGYRQSTE